MTTYVTALLTMIQWETR